MSLKILKKHGFLNIKSFNYEPDNKNTEMDEIKELTREELKKEVGLLLERFDENPDADMHIFTEGIVDIANAYIKFELINNRKKIITDYLERALVNEC